MYVGDGYSEGPGIWSCDRRQARACRSPDRGRVFQLPGVNSQRRHVRGRHGGLSAWARWVSRDDISCGINLLADHPLGYPMAKNLRAKIPATDTIVIHDVNRDTLKRFVAEAEVARASCRSAERGGRVEVADSPRRIGERSVSQMNISRLPPFQSSDECLFYR